MCLWRPDRGISYRDEKNGTALAVLFSFSSATPARYSTARMHLFRILHRAGKRPR
jgi:hypothetical protein